MNSLTGFARGAVTPRMRLATTRREEARLSALAAGTLTMHALAMPAWKTMLVRPRSVACAVIAALALLDVSLLIAREAPSVPSLQKLGFDMESAGFKARFANDPAGKAALSKLPPYRFVVHNTPKGPRYLFADPAKCMCTFVGTGDNYRNYQDIVRNGLPQADYVAPDYKTQASALLADDPIQSDSVYWEPDSISDAFNDYW
ncbi:hypothetical protein [Tardiphaga sp.]|jgi:hypothetical protein|uniref:hypothetical protein n=1 Tax=Tardiphaga sp. TaxID=1926292 RepID=UPI0037DA0111